MNVDTAGTSGAPARRRWVWMARAPRRGLSLRTRTISSPTCAPVDFGDDSGKLLNLPRHHEHILRSVPAGT